MSADGAIIIEKQYRLHFALEGKRLALIEKNLLAAENERIRAEQAREKNN